MIGAHYAFLDIGLSAGWGGGGRVDDRNIQNASETCGRFEEIFVTDS